MAEGVRACLFRKLRNCASSCNFSCAKIMCLRTYCEIQPLPIHKERPHSTQGATQTLLAEGVGFEPTGDFRHAWFSRPARYDHFGIPPKSIYSVILTFIIRVRCQNLKIR